MAEGFSWAVFEVKPCLRKIETLVQQSMFFWENVGTNVLLYLQIGGSNKYLQHVFFAAERSAHVYKWGMSAHLLPSDTQALCSSIHHQRTLHQQVFKDKPSVRQRQRQRQTFKLCAHPYTARGHRSSKYSKKRQTLSETNTYCSAIPCSKTPKQYIQLQNQTSQSSEKKESIFGARLDRFLASLEDQGGW